MSTAKWQNIAGSKKIFSEVDKKWETVVKKVVHINNFEYTRQN